MAKKRYKKSAAGNQEQEVRDLWPLAAGQKRLAISISILSSIFSVLLSVFTPDFSWGMPWSKDMFDQPSMKAQEEISPFIPDGIVPTKGKTLPIKNRDEAIKLKNPFAPTDRSIAWGKVLYNSYCALCHGETGHGDGRVGEKYVTPTDLTDEYVQNKPDGDIYYTITYGGLAVMPLFGDAISPEDRWHIINYIKSVIGRK